MANKPFRSRSRVLSAAILGCFAASASALPVDPTVVAGSAVFHQAGAVLNVTNSNGAIINWQQFNIGAGETTRFIQPTASSAVLNRVLAADPSLLYGTLASNGKVFLVNPAGILVGAGARIDTAGFVASTLAIKDSDFLAGKLSFGQIGAAANGLVSNQGTITTVDGGSVYLIGANVSNQGIIHTPGGEAILAAGQTVQLVDTATPGVKVEITGDGTTTNLGSILADAGRIGLTGAIVRNSGTLNASSLVKEGGKVFLRASKDAYVDGSGRIVTTGTKGGSIEVLGNRVAVTDNASLDASGSTGGGTLLVGGDYQGKNPDVQNSQISYLGPAATLKANATDSGDGGKVIVWADDTTRAYGTIEARGGPNGGKGGFVETSGHRYLDFSARVDTRAPLGKTGTLLLDPNDVYISSSDPTNSANASFYAGTPSYFTTSDSAESTVSWLQLETQLGTSDVAVTTYGGGSGGEIHVDGFTYNANHKLSLLAHTEIDFYGSVINTGSGDLLALAGWDGNVTAPGVSNGFASIYFDPSTTLSSKGGSIELIAGYQIDDSSHSAHIVTYGGAATLKAGAGVTFGYVMTSPDSAVVGSDAGNVSIVAGGDLHMYGGIIAMGAASGTNPGDSAGKGGSVLVNAKDGNITLEGDIQTAGGYSLSGFAGDGGKLEISLGGTSVLTTQIGSSPHMITLNGQTNTSGGYTSSYLADQHAGRGGSAGTVLVTTQYATYGGTITLNNSIDARGRDGQNSAGFAFPGGLGGKGGNVTLRATRAAAANNTLPYGDVVFGTNGYINATGGTGGAGNPGGAGGDGGTVTLDAVRDISLVGNYGIDTSGGDGRWDSAAYGGGSGGRGGDVVMIAGHSITTNRSLNASGGEASSAGDAGTGNLGGIGGRGGDITLTVTQAEGLIDLTLSTLNTSGGNAGSNQAQPNGPGGQNTGGDGGNVDIRFSMYGSLVVSDVDFSTRAGAGSPGYANAGMVSIAAYGGDLQINASYQYDALSVDGALTIAAIGSVNMVADTSYGMRIDLGSGATSTGSLSITAGDGIRIGDVMAGAYSYGHDDNGLNGGDISLHATGGNIITGDLLAFGGYGRSGASRGLGMTGADAGNGGNGGYVSVTADAGYIHTGLIDVYGGGGGHGGLGGSGISGVSGEGTVSGTNGTIGANGGTGGDGGGRRQRVVDRQQRYFGQLGHRYPWWTGGHRWFGRQWRQWWLRRFGGQYQRR
jgi:filamentous hemagglutinin family protein